MTIESNDPRLTAYALGELSGDEGQEFEALLATDGLARAEVAEIRETSALLERELGQPSGLRLPARQVERIAGALAELGARPVEQPKRRRRLWAALSLAAALPLLASLVMVSEREMSEPQALNIAASAVGTTIAQYEPLELAPLATAEEASPRAKGKPSENSYRGPGGFERRAARENYDEVRDNPFVSVARDSRSTFSIDVDTASYSLVRRFLNDGQRPPRGAVRIEELVNYFSYSYPEPRGGEPFSLSADVASAPWAADHRLVRIGLKARHIAPAARQASNLVFLIDVSGSMNEPNKLPLVKEGLSMLARELDARDHVSIVVYAGSSGLVLPPTPGSDKGEIARALDRLEAGGSTNGGEGIELAYAMAARHFVPGGVNRVILATDGDFNVGVTSQSDLVELIERKAKSGVFLSVLGFGRGNYQDGTLEKLADKGNGNYAYIDSRREARKVLVEQASGTLLTVAKDVKIQVEFNPSEVESFRLIGYENRVLSHRDFNDDRKDAGEIGADHTVTALYELIPALEKDSSGELMKIKLRYKLPNEDESRLMELAVRNSELRWPVDFRFASAVAEFGMLLRDSPHKGSSSYAGVLERAQAAVGDGSDRDARREFVGLVQKARTLVE